MIDTSTGLGRKFSRVRKRSLKLCDPLETEDYVAQPVTDVSPPKWHLAHTTWFFEQFVLHKFKKNFQWYNEDYPYLFNSYYESVGERVLRPKRGNMTRPTVGEIVKYRLSVDEQMEELLNNEDGLTREIAEIIELGLHHEQQHQELLVTDLKYILGNNPLFPVYDHKSLFRDHTNGQPSESNWVEVPEGVYTIGHDGEGFCFDNEKGVHKVFLHGFRILDRLITNGEFMEFIDEGGYEDFHYWLSEGWDWVNNSNIKAPLYWHKRDDIWYHYTLQGFMKVDPEEPLTHVSFYEADACARWRGKRLLTEFEWEVACREFLKADVQEANLADRNYFRPVIRRGENNQMWGDVWEWTNSAYLPYPFYKPSPGALGEYNGKFMINQMVLRGGSCATPDSHIRTTYRNFWHPHLRWQFTGFRLAEHID